MELREDGDGSRGPASTPHPRVKQRVFVALLCGLKASPGQSRVPSAGWEGQSLLTWGLLQNSAPLLPAGGWGGTALSPGSGSLARPPWAGGFSIDEVTLPDDILSGSLGSLGPHTTPAQGLATGRGPGVWGKQRRKAAAAEMGRVGPPGWGGSSQKVPSLLGTQVTDT